MHEDGKWNFPSASGISIQGFNNIGEEFKDNPIISLAKEICQNSLDTKFITEYNDTSGTIKVAFDEFWIKNTDIPGYDDFVEVFKNEFNFNNSFYEHDKEVPKFYENGLEILKKDNIRCLRIADYNTTGLIGSNKTKSSPWCNLTKNAGVSDKPEGSGGSKGKGKFASFVCSSLYTVFYSTYAKDELKAYCGISRLSGFDLTDGNRAIGEGYYENNGELFRIPKLLNLEKNYPRTEYGTDIYIIGFKEESEEWKKQIIASIIDNFFLALFKNELEISICHDEYVLNSSNVEEYIKDEDISKYLNNATSYYYEILNNYKNDVIEIPYTFLSENDLVLKLRVDDIKENFSSINTVAAIRSTGMKILDIKYLPKLGCYHGILEMTGTEVNDYFRKLENATHNKWSAKRSSNPEDAQSKIDKLTNFVKESIRKYLTTDIKEEMDAEGIGELLPDEYIFDSNYDENFESLTNDNVSKLEIQDTPALQKKNPTKKSDDGEDDIELDPEGNIIKNKKPKPNPTPSPDPHPNPNPRQKENYSQIKRRIIPNKIRMINKNIMLSSNEDEDIIKVDLNISGEGYTEKAYLTSVMIIKGNDNTSFIDYEYNDNYIIIKNVKANEMYTISYELDSDENWTMEVSLYGNESK